jgi:hypothetical protein
MKLQCIKCDRVIDIERAQCVCTCGNMMYPVAKKKKQAPVIEPDAEG